MPSSFATLQARIASRLTVISCGVGVLGIGVLTCLGYALGIIGLYQWHPQAIGMAPNTALAFLLSGMGLTVLGSSNRVWRCN